MCAMFYHMNQYNSIVTNNVISNILKGTQMSINLCMRSVHIYEVKRLFDGQETKTISKFIFAPRLGFASVRKALSLGQPRVKKSQLRSNIINTYSSRIHRTSIHKKNTISFSGSFMSSNDMFVSSKFKFFNILNISRQV